MRPREEERALFWCQLLGELLFEREDQPGWRRQLRALAGREVRFPDGRLRRISLRTLRRKLLRYRKGGFEALARKARGDRGQVRCVPSEVLQTAIAAKKEQPKRSALMLNRILEERHGKSLARSTLYRHLKAAGATRMRLGLSRQPVRKRWSCERSNQMWIGDFEHGPRVLLEGQARPTRLSAFIDVCSRFVVSGRYYLSERLEILAESLWRGFEVHGLPESLYVDNAKVYHAHILQRACYRLGVRLRHRPVRDPAAGGLVERFFQTVQNQFEAEIRARSLLELRALNEAFSAWLEELYHRTANSETGETPLARYEGALQTLRPIDPQALSDSFLQRLDRHVNRTFSDVQLYDRFYRVDPRYRGERVEVRFLPFLLPPQEVYLYSLQGLYLGAAPLHQREQGQRPEPTPPPGACRFDPLAALVRDHRRRLQSVAVDYSRLNPPKPWPFERLAGCLAELLGRKGGLCGFDQAELHALRQIHSRYPTLTRHQIRQAVAHSAQPTLAAIAWQLQLIHQAKEL